MMVDIVMSDSERLIMIKHHLNKIFMMFIAIITYIQKNFEGGGTGPPGPPLDPPLYEIACLHTHTFISYFYLNQY